MSKNQISAPLSRFGVLVAQMESIVASAVHKSPEPLLCFDLLSDLISAIDEDTKDNILVWQRRCEDALYSLLVIGARRPVRHLASVAMSKIMSKGDGISVYSRASSLQGFLSDGKRSEPQKIAGAAQCLGELYKHFGRKITSGLLETTIIAAKLMRFSEEFVRQEALYMLQNALEGSGGSAASTAYSEAFRLIMRSATGDKSFAVRIAAARCLKAFASIGGPGLGVAELDNSASYCVKALEDPVPSVRDAFAETLGSLLALGMNPEAQIQPRGKGPLPQAKKLEGGLQKHLILAFTKASGARSREVRVGLTRSWVSFLQAIHIKYLHPDSDLQNFALQVMEMLRAETSVDAHALACVLYALRVGVTDQMTEPTQRNFSVFLGKQLQSPEAGPSMKVAALRTLSYTLKTLGEVPFEFKEVLDNTVVAAVSHSSKLVRIEAALALRALAEVDPTCVSGLISYGVTNLTALRESVSFEKGSNLQFELDSLHGQATVLAALVSISPKLPLGYPTRLPRLVFGVSKKLLTEHSRNPVAATVEKEAGWLLLSSLLASLPKEELEEDVFDILALWATLFNENPENEITKTEDLMSRIYVWSAAVHALTAFIKCFISPNVVNGGVLLQPVLVYLNSALSYISALRAKELPNVKPAVDIFIIKTLIAYQSLPDPMSFKNDHPQIIELCTFPFRHASECEESSCLRLLLDKRDAWLGPWIPGRDWFEDELRAFQGGKDGIMPCVWENEISSFPQPETISKTLVNQMLLFFGIIFASQDSGGMLSLLGDIEQCLKAGKKQHWHTSSITNICVGLLAGFKALLSFKPQTLGQEILGLIQSIFQSILAEGDICASQRRASCEGLGYLARFGNDIFTARMTRSLLGDLNGATDSYYVGSITLALGCIHRSAGGIALSTLVPATVSSISSLAKSLVANLQIWSMHGLLLTIEAAGLSFVSHVQATLSLAMDILLSDENGLVDIQQGVGRLINAIVTVLGPELVPGSIFFSRSKSAIAEISCWQDTSTMLESARFTQQLVLFAPQAVSVHSHVQTLLSTLSSKQPNLRHLAVSTLRHLIEKDPASVIVEQIEDNLFFMLDEETDSEIGNLVRTTIMRLLYASCPSCPSHWISVCRKVVLATSARNTENNNIAASDNSDGDSRLNLGDEENMVSGSNSMHTYKFQASIGVANREKYLRYRTRLFAAECLSHLPDAVGRNPAHFDLFLARKEHASAQATGDWLVFHLQELISLAYQISTIQFENMQPVGVGLLGTIVDKFEKVADPELPGHLLLEQYQAQLVSAVRTTLDTSSSPSLLEAGLHLATKILTSGIISGDQVVVKRIFSLISRPLNDFEDIYYPSFAEWVTSKIKIRLLAAHASLKCYIYASMRKHQDGVPDEYLALLPLFQKSSSVLGKYWIHTLKDYSFLCLCLIPKKKWNLFLDGLQSPIVSSKLRPCLDESWPVILQALALDAVPVNSEGNDCSKASVENTQKHSVSTCQYSMVELKSEDFKFLWGFSLLGLFQSQHPILYRPIIQLAFVNAKHGGNSPSNEVKPSGLKLYEIILPMFQFLSTESFFGAGLLTIDICKELLQILSYSTYMDNSWNRLAISILSQVAQNCPEEIFSSENFALTVMELCLHYLFNVFQSTETISVSHPNSEVNVIQTLCSTTKAIINRIETKMHKHSKSVVLALVLIGYQCVREASSEVYLSEAIDVVNCTSPLLKRIIDGDSKTQQSGDLQSIHSAYRLNGKNYLKWSQLICTILKGKGKHSHLIDAGPDQKDPKFSRWEEEDSMIMAWLWNSMVPEISDTCMFLNSAKEIWEAVEQTYSKAKDAAQVYDVKVRTVAAKQGSKTVTEYANQLKSLWMELDHYRVIKAKCSEDSAVLKEYIEQDRVYDFLVGLNPEFDQVRIQILGKQKVPGINEVVAIVRSEESRRGLMLDAPAVESSAMIADLNKGDGSLAMVAEQKRGGLINMEKKNDEIWCTYCNKPRHTREKCWKLHGKPQNRDREWGNKGNREWGHKGNFSKKGGQVHMAAGTSEDNKGEPAHLNQEEIERVRTFLSKLEKPTGTCSVAYSGKFLFSFGLNVSDTPFNKYWILDSGATDHMTHLPKHFYTYTPCPSNKKIATADGTLITAAGQGDVQISPSITLKNVLHVPKLSTNLISIQKLTKDLSCNVVFHSNACVLQDKTTGRTIGHAREWNGLYYIENPNLGIHSFISESVMTNKEKKFLYHCRLGHPSFRVIKMLFPALFKKLDVESLNCEVCELAKHKRVPFPISNKVSTFPFYLVHTDVWGPSNVSSVTGARWFVTFIDDCTRVTWVFLLKQKSEVSSVFLKFFSMIKNQFGVNIKRLRSDNAKDYFNLVLTSFCQKEGIIHESSCVKTPQQNGIAERKNGHLLNQTRALLFQNNVPKFFWGEAVLTATHLINRLPSRVLESRSPMEVLSSFYPNWSTTNNLKPRIFGCVSFVHIHNTDRGKLDPRALRCVFVGYSSTQKGYKCYHPPTKKICVSRDVTFHEQESYYSKPHLQGENLGKEDEPLMLSDMLSDLTIGPEPAANEVGPEPQTEDGAEPEMDVRFGKNRVYSKRQKAIPKSTHVQESNPAPLNEVTPSDPTISISQISDNPIVQVETEDQDDLDLPIAIRKGTRKCTKLPLYPLSNYLSFKNFSPTHKAFLTNLNTTTIPTSLSEALSDRKWKQAMDLEMEALEKNCTWEMVTLPTGKKPVGCKWVYAVKYKADGSIERYKARLVAKGFTQTYGVDYLETFAPVAKMNTVRVLLSLAANHDWDLQQFDVKNAFLHGDLEEEIYMELPPGYGEQVAANTVCRLKKALYGLKQSPRAWFGRFTKVMTGLGYKQSQGDHTLFIKHSNSGGVTVLLVYVDDIIVTGDDKEEQQLLSHCLAKEFEIKTLGKLKYFLGIEVAHSKKGIFISQQKYITDLLKETGKTACRPANTPVDTSIKLGNAEEDVAVDKEMYQRLVGRLIYLSHTRPDIAFSVSLISQFMHQPKETHLQAALRIVQYLKGTPGRGILFKRNRSVSLEAYTDADYAGSIVDRRSTTGYCTFLGGNLVTWKSKKQSVVARSSAEAEFRAMAQGICELLWLKIILEDLKIKRGEPMRLYCDNKSAISIAHNPVQHDRTKHIEVDRHFIKEKLDSGMICTPYVSTQHQLADILTKGLNSNTFEKIVTKLGMENTYSPA